MKQLSKGLSRVAKRLSFAGIILIMASLPAAADGPGDCTNIQTDKGRITGVMSAKQKLCVYKGIPFAAPPVGELRFAPPKEPAPWAETLKANRFGNECFQFPLGVMAAMEPTGNEDCLYLNVWQPVSAADSPKPVMVFIHGGGFVMGSGSQPWYEASKLAAAGDLIVVTINYRLGPFGFLAHPALKDAEGHVGNYGFLDQVAALKWVNRNIRNFGGDPGNVTIFGESAGGMSVGVHLVSPLSKGLFAKAIIESGPPFLMRGEVGEALEKGEKAAEALGCYDADAAGCLRSLDPAFIMRTLKPVMNMAAEDEDVVGNYTNSPIVEGYAVPANPLEAVKNGAFDKKIKIMIGSNQNEAAIFTAMRKMNTKQDFDGALRKDADKFRKVFGLKTAPDGFLKFYKPSSFDSPKQCYNAILTDLIFTCPTKVIADALADQGADTYLYYFTKHFLDKGITKDWGAFHSAELFFIFGNMSFMGVNGNTPENQEMSKTMMGLWTSFARMGLPTAPGVPAWPRYDSKTAMYMQLDVKSSVREKLKKAECEAEEEILKSAGK